MEQIIRDRQQGNKGQVMLFVILILAATFLSATVIAGLLMFYQLDQVTKVGDSAQAIFAADAALERGLFIVSRCNTGKVPFDVSSLCAVIKFQLATTPGDALPTFFNDAGYQLSILPSVDALPETFSSIRATGRSGSVSRAFEATAVSP